LGEFCFAEHAKGEEGWYDKELKRYIKTDGYYEKQVRWTEKELRKEIEEMFPILPHHTFEEQMEIEDKQDIELQKVVDAFKASGMFADSDNDRMKVQIFEFYGCLYHGHDCKYNSEAIHPFRTCEFSYRKK